MVISQAKNMKGDGKQNLEVTKYVRSFDVNPYQNMWGQNLEITR